MRREDLAMLESRENYVEEDVRIVTESQKANMN